jgi:hypothetical protein
MTSRGGEVRQEKQRGQRRREEARRDTGVRVAKGARIWRSVEEVLRES